MTLVQTTCPNCGHTQDHKSKYLYDIEVGKTLFFEGVTRRHSSVQCAYQYGKRVGKKFKATTVDGGVIVERVE